MDNVTWITYKFIDGFTDDCYYSMKSVSNIVNIAL